MKDDFARIRAIHELTRAFTVDSATVQALIDQIEEVDKRNNVGRFIGGYRIEDAFEELFSQLPEVGLLHALKQEQSPSESKADYQVPDFIAFLSALDGTVVPLFVETKSAVGEKVTLWIMVKQVAVIQHYCGALGHPLVYANYWEKFRVWTVNTVDQFDKHPTDYRISFESAYLNDLSAIFGDQTLIFASPIYRRSTFDSAVTDGIAHQKYGGVITDEISADGTAFSKLEPLQSALIDSSIQLKETYKRRSGSRTDIREESAAGYMLKLTTMIPRHLSVAEGMPFNEKSIRVSQHTILSVARMLQGTLSTAVPKERTAEADYLLKRLFVPTGDQKPAASAT